MLRQKISQQVVVFLVFIGLSSHCFGMLGLNDLSYGRYGGAALGLQLGGRGLQKAIMIGEIDKAMTQNATRMNEANNELTALVDNDLRRQQLEAAIVRYTETDRVLRDSFNQLVQPSSPGKIIAEAMVDKDCRDVIEDSRVESIVDGMFKGLMVIGFKSVGEVVKEKSSATLHTLLGGTWDYAFGRLIDFSSDISCLIFHGGKEPFTLEEITAWHKMIDEILKDVETMLKEGMRESMRSHDMTLRQFDTSDGNDADKSDNVGKEEEQEKEVTLWTYLIRGYVMQFQHFVKEVEKRKPYYKQDSQELFYANQIQMRLEELCKVLHKADSLRSLLAGIESSKSVIVAISHNIASLFARLEDLIKPRSYSLNKKSSGSDRVGTKVKHHTNRYYDDHGNYDNFPNPM